MTTTLPDALSDATRTFVSRTHGLLIGAESVPAADGATFETLDPATADETLGVLLKAREDLDAIRGAKLAELIADVRPDAAAQ